MINLRRMLLASLFAALTAICAWISLPVLDIAFTMQTFSIFLTLGVLGGKWGSVSILIYLLLGAAGMPVFSGFQGGIGALMGVTGGYIWGFLLSGLVYWLLEILMKPVSKWGRGAAMAAAMAVCYLCGSLWFQVYAGGGLSLWAVALKCVVPYLIPDAVKIAMAATLSGRLEQFALRFAPMKAVSR